jgi:chromosome segregation ATPase
VIIMRYTITLPEEIATKLAADEGRLGIPRSTLIAEYLRKHYTEKPVAEYEAALSALQKQSEENERQAKENESQAQTDKEELEKLISQSKEWRARIAATTKELEGSLGKLAEMTAKAASQDIVISGLQNELEITKTQLKSLEDKVVIYTGLNNDLKYDKDALQKQLSDVTLRLPQAKVSFWSRVFGGRGSKKEKKEGGKEDGN